MRWAENRGTGGVNGAEKRAREKKVKQKNYGRYLNELFANLKVVARTPMKQRRITFAALGREQVPSPKNKRAHVSRKRLIVGSRKV